MSKLRTQQEAPQSASFSSLDCSKARKDVSPPAGYPPRASLDKKHIGAIRPYRPKKSQQNTPSPLAQKDDDSRSRQDTKSISRCGAEHQHSKKQFQSCRPSKKKSDLEQIYRELIALKTEYKALKQAYNSLLREKQQAFLENKQKSQELLALNGEASRLRKDNERMRNQIVFAEHELERIKKECYKLLEIENFRNQKLDQTLQEKELMIHYLRAQLGKENHEINTSSIGRNIFLQSTTPIFRAGEFDFVRAAESVKQTNQSIASLESIFQTVKTEHQRSKIVLSSISEHDKYRNASQISDDSLIFSKDNNPKSINIESIAISPNRKPDSDLPSCCTFQLKDQETEKGIDKQEKRFTKRKLEINTDEGDGDYQNVYCDQAPSVETKKRSETGSKPRRNRQREEPSFENSQLMEHRMKQIDVGLQMDRNHRLSRTNRQANNNSSYR